MSAAALVFTQGCPDILRPRKRRYAPRRNLLCEVVAGFLWLALEIPKEFSKEDVEDIALRLIARIRAGSTAAQLEQEMLTLQRSLLHRFGNAQNIHLIAPRLLSAVGPA